MTGLVVMRTPRIQVVISKYYFPINKTIYLLKETVTILLGQEMFICD